MLVDSHVNLHGEKFADDSDEVVARAVEAGVGTMLNICCKMSDFDDVVASSEAEQIHNFKAHIIAARETKLPLIIHTREADDLMMDTLQTAIKEEGPFAAELHCYTSGPELAKWGADQGFYFSVSGILTFKNAHDAKAMPDDRIMLETDCPYLAPVPHRGRRNEPAYVREVCQALADVKGWSFDDTAQRTTNAFFNLFTKATRAEAKP